MSDKYQSGLNKAIERNLPLVQGRSTRHSTLYQLLENNNYFWNSEYKVWEYLNLNDPCPLLEAPQSAINAF